MNRAELRRFAQGPKERRTEVTAENGAKGTLACKEPGVWCLNAHANRYRNRWGNKQEILADLAYFQRTGELPPATSQQW